MGCDPSPASAGHAVQLRLDGFEGPLDLLLDLARRQRVDLSRISVAVLVDQFVDAVTGADRRDLIQAADWLVMAAWLTWLKSRLLLPADPADAHAAEQSRQVLTRRLAELERVRATADWLHGQQQLGWDVFERGHRERPEAAVALATPMMLMQACLGVFRRAGAAPPESYRPRRILQWTPQQAIARLQAMLARGRGGDLLDFVPTLPASLPQRDASLRAAVASTLIAGLELARDGRVHLQQDVAFAPIRVEAAPESG